MICIKSIFALFICMLPLVLLGQTHMQNALSKIDKSPYSMKQNAWLNERGFYVLNYDWSNKSINSKLDQAILNRTLGKVTLVAAAGSFALGGLSYLVSEMADEADQKNDNYKNFFTVSGGLVAASIVFSLNAKGKVKKAVLMRGL